MYIEQPDAANCDGVDRHFRRSAETDQEVLKRTFCCFVREQRSNAHTYYTKRSNLDHGLAFWMKSKVVFLVAILVFWIFTIVTVKTYFQECNVYAI